MKAAIAEQAREGRCACGCARSPGGTLCCTSDDGAHLQSYSMLDRRRDLCIYARKILSGDKAADLPVIEPIRFEL